jgi:hypothetical protein
VVKRVENDEGRRVDPGGLRQIFDVNVAQFVGCLRAAGAVRLDFMVAAVTEYMAACAAGHAFAACTNAHERDEAAVAATFGAKLVRFIRGLRGIVVISMAVAGPRTPTGNHQNPPTSTDLPDRARAPRLASGSMKFIGTVFALVCTALGGLQVWAAARRRADEFFILRSSGQSSLLAFEFAGSPVRLRGLLSTAGDRGRAAVMRSLDIDYLLTAGFLFVALGCSGILTAVSRPGLARWTLVFGLIASLVGLVENVSLRQAAVSHPNGGGTAPLVTFMAIARMVLLLLAAGCVLLWPIRTFLN